MAKMYPASFLDVNKSSGERKVFEHFKNDAPKDWIVLHSFRLPEHRTVVFGEADFIVIAPNFGVFVLEVKSGGVGFDGTNWIFRNRNGKENLKHRGPFQQANDAMFKVSDIVTRRLGESYDRRHILYGYGVIFTDETDFPREAIVEDEPWRLYQKSDGTDYSKFVADLSVNFAKELRSLRKNVPGKLTVVDAQKIQSCLRPEVECIVPLKSFLDDSEDGILRLTNEQYDCLDELRENVRVVALGGAGTGKTLIAAQAARAAAAAGERVGLLCFNRNLSEYLRYNLASTDVEVNTLHSLMQKTAKVYEDEAGGDFFEKELPEKACAALNGAIFDRLIVDEFQDICIPEYLAFLDGILKGGLRDGKFAFFGDFSGQAIYNRRAAPTHLNVYVPYYAVKHLTVNCRNTESIGKEVVAITGYTEQKYLLKVQGEPVDYIGWEDIEEEKCRIKELLKSLNTQGLSGESVVILSPRKRENSVVGQLDRYGYFIGDYGQKDGEVQAYFSTIHSFKGLESRIVILVDIEGYDDVKLMYTALSRARNKLYVFENRNAYEQRKERALRGASYE